MVDHSRPAVLVVYAYLEFFRLSLYLLKRAISVRQEKPVVADIRVAPENVPAVRKQPVVSLALGEYLHAARRAYGERPGRQCDYRAGNVSYLVEKLDFRAFVRESVYQPVLLTGAGRRRNQRYFAAGNCIFHRLVIRDVAVRVALRAAPEPVAAVYVPCPALAEIISEFLRIVLEFPADVLKQHVFVTVQAVGNNARADLHSDYNACRAVVELNASAEVLVVKFSRCYHFMHTPFF